jgi:hypothetical protein
VILIGLTGHGAKHTAYGLTLEQIKGEMLNGRDLSKKGSRRRQVEYVVRTAEKAFRSGSKTLPPVTWSAF